MTSEQTPRTHSQGRAFWVGAALGWAGIAWGLAGIVRQRVDTRPGDLVRFVVGGIVLHDAVAVPLALVVALALARALPGPIRRWVQAGLVIVAVLALFSYPLVRNYGAIPGNPTVLPYNYATNLALVCLAVVVVLAATAATRALLARRRRATSP